MKPTSPAAVTIIGLGYVGFPLAAALSSGTDTTVYGLITSQEKAGRITDKTYNPDIPGFSWKGITITATTSPETCLPHSDVIVVCVPTPVSARHKPDITALKSVLKTIGRHLHSGQLIIIESTVGPGMMEQVCIPLLERSGFRAGQQFDVSYCPERINPGDTVHPLTKIPRIVASTSPAGLTKTTRFYERIIRAPIVPVQSFGIAETAKMLENAFRDVNMALIHEFALACETLRIPIADVIAAAATKPFGFMPFYPRTGVGGDCIPVDPWYQIDAGNRHGFSHRLLTTARTINASYPKSITTYVRNLCRHHRINPKRHAVGIYGLSYKSGTKSLSNSPARIIAKQLRKIFRVHTYDDAHPELSTVNTVYDLVNTCRVLVVCTDDPLALEALAELLHGKTSVTLLIDGSYTLRSQLADISHITVTGIGIPE